MTATTIQTIAALIQALAAAVFLFGVRVDYRRREQERREKLIEKLLVKWSLAQHPGRTEEEAHRILSQRQIEYLNVELKAQGERWTYPFRPLGWW